MRLLPYGADGLLVELDDPRAVPAARAALAGLAEVIESVAGARTVLVTLRANGEAAVRHLLDTASFTAADTADAPLIEIPVSYDGADLAAVAELIDAAVDEVVELHRSGEYTVRFCGFSPGFAYLDGLPERLHVPRRDEPRATVPGGSVAIAGEFTGVYPHSSPGGWQLLGRTPLALWDVDRDPPALLAPGTRVRFVPA